ncbi:MAG: ligase-associated DNA damage response DEXH box helicase [Micavibrio aeruginosavorus]|uniref:Ligase-associated DNA damage response DEXH box helicase n=1 Tax=Micavibrio aeruginosavorus TaxID=349221 RepID=A0A2W5HMJ8_9BACT|nr:MAG: ligase-associated DNA damage response DEXH box helicase [Micavibrio aeruginosavorus]
MAQQSHKNKNGRELVKDKALEAHPLTLWLKSRGWDWFPHQLDVLETAHEGKDLILSAPTGSGKTLAGFLPSLIDLTSGTKIKGLHTIYISPLKALATDVHRNVGRPIKEADLKITYETRTGDTKAGARTRQKTKPPNILMTTPESLALLLSYTNAAEYFKDLRYIIIDELHALMSSKRGDLLSLGIARLSSLAPNMQKIGLSATLANPDIAKEWLCGPQGEIVLSPAKTLPDIKILKSESRIPWAGHMATYAMPEIYEEISKARMSVVFVNTRAQAELIFQNLWKINDKNLKIGLHHGSLERTIRQKVEAGMAQGLLNCVVATSSLDLGLDWAEVDLVLQIGAPKGISRLLQRIGRSNHRLNEPSKAVLVPTNRFEWLECIAAKDAILHKEMDGQEARKGGLDVLAQHIFGTACAGPFCADKIFAEVKTAWPYQELTRSEFDRVLEFVTDGGYALKTYDRFKKIQVNEQGLHELTSKRFAQLYRMNIGTIVESPLLKVKMGRKYLGTIEEYFINNLSAGDTFYFAGHLVEYKGMHETDVMVARGKGDDAKIPSYDGGKLPLSTHLSLRVRELIERPENWKLLPDTVCDWLQLQSDKSEVPGTEHLLVEVFPRSGRFYMVAYPFAGYSAHKTLGFLLLRRMARLGYKPLGFVQTDYAVCVWSLREPKGIEDLFSVDLLGEELHEWLLETPLLKRTFREAAVIAGLIERRHPGQQKTGKQMTFSSDLIYDVLQKYEPDHILLRAAREDATSGLIDTGRLSDMLINVQGKIRVKHLDQVSPLAVPMMLELAREGVPRKEQGEYFIQDLEESLMIESGLNS